MSSANSLPSAQTIFSELYFQNPTSKLIGLLLNYFLVGTLLVQFYIYRTCFPRDMLVIKMLVYFVLFACVFCGLCETLYVIGVISGAFETFTGSQYLWFASPVFGALMATLVQLFYCFRMVTLCKRVWPLASLIGLVAIAEWAVTLASVVLQWNGSVVADRHRTILFYFYFVAGAITDVLIAAIMTTLLLRGGSMVPQTRGLVKNIVRLIIETNTLTAIAGLLAILMFLCAPQTLYYLSPTLLIPGIYANTLLVVLNERAVMRLASSDDAALMLLKEEGSKV
ncbi:hypothetical protein C8R46DRAFT_1191455 [Mycena filopes]|nr:hypothetical protein C8R46DRAFT_1191455 [Mycena filopes]